MLSEPSGGYSLSRVDVDTKAADGRWIHVNELHLMRKRQAQGSISLRSLQQDEAEHALE
jgi:hypothetical protein